MTESALYMTLQALFCFLYDAQATIIYISSSSEPTLIERSTLQQTSFPILITSEPSVQEAANRREWK